MDNWKIFKSHIFGYVGVHVRGWERLKIWCRGDSEIFRDIWDKSRIKTDGTWYLCDKVCFLHYLGKDRETYSDVKYLCDKVEVCQRVVAIT